MRNLLEYQRTLIEWRGEYRMFEAKHNAKGIKNEAQSQETHRAMG
jgi:hypothetical protein